VVHIMMVSAGPERHEVMQAPGELVARVGINGLEEAESDPGVHGDHMQILGDGAEDDWDADRSESEDHGFKRRSVLCCQTKWRAVLVMELVDQFIQSRLVQSTVKPVMPGIFQDEKQRDLPAHGNPRRERDCGGETEVLSQGVEKPDLR